MRFDKKIQRFPSGGGTVLSWGSELESRVFTSFHVVFIGAVDFFVLVGLRLATLS